MGGSGPCTAALMKARSIDNKWSLPRQLRLSWSHVSQLVPQQALAIFDKPLETATLPVVDGDGEEAAWELASPEATQTRQSQAKRTKGKPGPKPRARETVPEGCRSILGFLPSKRGKEPTTQEVQNDSKRRRAIVIDDDVVDIVDSDD